MRYARRDGAGPAWFGRDDAAGKERHTRLGSTARTHDSNTKRNWGRTKQNQRIQPPFLLFKLVPIITTILWQIRHCTFSLPQPPTAGGGYVCHFFCLEPCLPTLPTNCKYAISIYNLYQKYITRVFVCEIWGPHKVDKHTFQENTFLKKQECTSVLASPDLSKQLLS